MNRITLLLIFLFSFVNCTPEKKDDSQRNLLIIAAGLASAASSSSAAAASSTLTGEALAFQKAVNEHRVSVGCKALVEYAALNKNAQNHSQDMKDRNFFSHTNPDGKSPFDRMKADGISYEAAAENIAQGQSTGASVLQAWLNSSGHKTNIENCNYTHHGIGYVSSGHYWTHVFAKNPK